MIGGNVSLAVLALLGAPLFLVISALALLGFWSTGRPPADVTGEIGKLVQMDTLITIPLFTFAGFLLAESGAPKRLVAVSKALFGWFPGGMAMVTLVTCAFFTTFTGASGITIVALGGLLLPVLLHQKYPREFSLGLVTTSGSRGLIFPPSLPVIIYGYVAAVDITADRTHVVTMMITTSRSSLLPPRRWRRRPITVATPLSCSPADRTKIAPRAITALLPKPFSAAVAGSIVPVTASTIGMERAVASSGMALLMNSTIATTRVPTAIQA